MKESQVEEYLRVLEGMVIDEEKIVTYKLLARTLGINVNIAKQILYMFLLEQQKKSPIRVSASHLLAGLSKDGTFLVSIISDDKLDESYGKYEKITSEHVYSIQKGNASGLEKNSQVLFAADLSLPPPNSYPIKYHKVLEIKKEDERNKNISQNGQMKTYENSDEIQDQKALKQSPGKDEKQKTNKHRSLVNMFKNQSQQKNLVLEEKIKDEEETEKFSKNFVESETEMLSVDEHSKGKKFNEKPSRQSDKKMEKKKDKKKRKRILSASEDSESDEEQRDALLCAEPEISDVTQSLKITDDDGDEELFCENKRRRKKVVDKTVLLQDGFMETHKEVVYESDSDEESPKQKKKEAKLCHQPERKIETKEESASKKMKVSRQTNNSKKQSTLLSFFKKI